VCRLGGFLARAMVSKGNAGLALPRSPRRRPFLMLSRLEDPRRGPPRTVGQMPSTTKTAMIIATVVPMVRSANTPGRSLTGSFSCSEGVGGSGSPESRSPARALAFSPGLFAAVVQAIDQGAEPRHQTINRSATPRGMNTFACRRRAATGRSRTAPPSRATKSPPCVCDRGPGASIGGECVLVRV